jgi:hypothetical protein
VPMQHGTSTKKKSESRSRTRCIGLGMIVVILLVLGIALWTPSPPISAATQGLIQGLQDTWQKVQEVFLSSDRHQSAPPTP